jgi:glutamyl/glutaminyl-tRNA synthetase
MMQQPVPNPRHYGYQLFDIANATLNVQSNARAWAVSVMAYRDAGFLPEALLNYLVRLGWSHGDQEVFSLAEMFIGWSYTRFLILAMIGNLT